MRRIAIFLLSAAVPIVAWSGGMPLEQTPGADQDVMIPLYQDSTGTQGDLATGKTVTAAEVYLSKNGADWVAKNDAGACTEDGGSNTGFYRCPLDSATDLNTAGSLMVKIVDGAGGSLPIPVSFAVYPTQVYDSLFGTDNLQTDPVALDGDATSMDDLKDFADAGYDPATNKVQGVVLVDATTTNTDMVGTDSAALASELAKVPKSDGTSTWNATALASINTEADTALTDYDPPTRAELTSDIAGVNTNVDATQTTIGAAGAGLTESGGTGDQLTALATASALSTHDGKLDTVDTNVDSTLQDLEAIADARDTSMRCTVDNTNFAPTTTVIQCDLADYDASAIQPSVANKFTGLPICSKTNTDSIYRDCRYIIATAQGDTDTNEWQFTVDRAWTAAPDNASVLYIRQ